MPCAAMRFRVAALASGAVGSKHWLPSSFSQPLYQPRAALVGMGTVVKDLAQTDGSVKDQVMAVTTGAPLKIVNKGIYSPAVIRCL